MQPYKNYAERDQAVRAVVALMQHDSQVRVQTYADDLLVILDNQVLDEPVGPEQDGNLTYTFAPHFMGVMVGVPSGRGSVELYTFSRYAGPVEPPTGVDRMIVDALLTNAKNQLYDAARPVIPAPPVYPQPYNPGF